MCQTRSHVSYGPIQTWPEGAGDKAFVLHAWINRQSAGQPAAIVTENGTSRVLNYGQVRVLLSDDAVVHLLDSRTGERTGVPIRFRRHPRPELFDGLLSERAVATAIVAASSRVTCYLAQTKSPWATTLAEHSARRTIAKAMGITRARATNESGRKAAEAFGGIGLRYAGAPQTTQQFEASENIRSTSLLAYGAHVAADAAATVCAGGVTVTSDPTSQNAIVSLAASLDAARRATPSSEQEVKDQHGAEACANAEPLTEWTREASKEMVKLSNAAKAAEAARRMKLAAAGPAKRRDDEQRIGLPPGALDEVRITLKMSERARREVGHQVQLSGANKDEWSFTLERRGFFFEPPRGLPRRRGGARLPGALHARWSAHLRRADARDARHRVVT